MQKISKHISFRMINLKFSRRRPREEIEGDLLGKEGVFDFVRSLPLHDIEPRSCGTLTDLIVHFIGDFLWVYAGNSTN